MSDQYTRLDGNLPFFHNALHSMCLSRVMTLTPLWTVNNNMEKNGVECVFR